MPGGEMVVADRAGSRSYRVGADGLLRPFTGNGLRVSSKDNGSAVAAGIPYPGAIAVDPTGIVFVSQSLGVIRRVTLTGAISTIAGTGVPGCPSVGALGMFSVMRPATPMAANGEGNLFVAPAGCGVIYRIDRASASHDAGRRQRRILPGKQRHIGAASADLCQPGPDECVPAGGTGTQRVE